MLKVILWLKVFRKFQYWVMSWCKSSPLHFQIFTGNKDRNTVQTNNVESLPRAKFIRFSPTAANEWPTLRVEIYGAAQGNPSFYVHFTLFFEFTRVHLMSVVVQLCIGKNRWSQWTNFIMRILSVICAIIINYYYYYYQWGSWIIRKLMQICY